MDENLFFGDSITDAERNRDAVNNSIKTLGYGFVRIIADTIGANLIANEWLNVFRNAKNKWNGVI